MNPRNNTETRRVWRRVVVKVGTNLLTGGTDHLDSATIEELVSQVTGLRKRGVEVVLVTSGAVTAGRELMNGRDLSRSRKDVSTRQVLASLGQVPLMHEYFSHFKSHGYLAAQALVSRIDLESDHGYLNARNTLLGLINAGAIPIVNENDVVAVEELEGEVFGDNDRLSARVADVVDADTLVILSDVAGLYDRDPNKHPDARLISVVDEITPEIAASGSSGRGERGRGGMATKIDAAANATSIGISVVIASGTESEILSRLHDGEELGTSFTPAATRLESKKRRILAALRNDSGRVLVNDGAVVALTTKNSSLLPPGIIRVTGSFDRGAYIEVCDEEGNPIAAGRANYSATDVNRIKGMRSSEARAVLSTNYGDEVIHRNNMVRIRTSQEPGGDR